MILLETETAGLIADGVDLAAIALYLAGVRRLARRGRRWSPSATAAFTCGIACLWVAVGSGLAGYDDDHATIHVIQHGLLMMVAPPLLALGRPVTLAIQAAHRPSQVRLVRLVHSEAVATLTFPASGWLAYYGAMYACFLDRRLYHFVLDHPLAHDGSHMLLVAIGYLYWQPLVGGDPSRWRLSQRAKAMSALSGTLVECLLGIAIVTFRQPFDSVNTLADTHMAGVFFVIMALVVCGLTTCFVVLDGPTRHFRITRERPEAWPI